MNYYVYTIDMMKDVSKVNEKWNVGSPHYVRSYFWWGGIEIEQIHRGGDRNRKNSYCNILNHQYKILVKIYCNILFTNLFLRSLDLAYNYKLSSNSLEIHKITMLYLLDICVLHLSVTTVLANASLLSYYKKRYSAFGSLNWWLHYHWDLEKNNTAITILEILTVLSLSDYFTYWDQEEPHCYILLILIQECNTLVSRKSLELNIQCHCWHESIINLLLYFCHFTLFAIFVTLFLLFTS